VTVGSVSNAPDLYLNGSNPDHPFYIGRPCLSPNPNWCRLTRTTGSRSHGLDQTALELILGVHLRSSGTEQKGKRGAALRRRRPKPAAAWLGTRRSSAFPLLRGPELHDFRPGSTTEARGNDLGLRLGLEGLGLCARR
jgi:hypothetical protein